MSNLKHPYHLVDLSPWPILLSITLLSFALNIVNFLIHESATIFIQISLILLIAFQWWRDVIRESLAGYHTMRVQRGILIGFLLFLLSEIMLFSGFFWAFFHSSLAPAIELGVTWPPEGINAVNPWAIPLLGSTVLVASGFVLTIAHHALIAGNKSLTIFTMCLTVLLGALFIFLQYNEYLYGEFTIADSVFGSVFYMTTGLHAIHVIIGVLFLAIALFRIFFDHFTTEHHLGFEFAIYYWHLVDVVWLFVFMTYYWWSN
jgi:cytochrome c oxidase subunit 3